MTQDGIFYSFLHDRYYTSNRLDIANPSGWKPGTLAPLHRYCYTAAADALQTPLLLLLLLLMMMMMMMQATQLLMLRLLASPHRTTLVPRSVAFMSLKVMAHLMARPSCAVSSKEWSISYWFVSYGEFRI